MPQQISNRLNDMNEAISPPIIGIVRDNVASRNKANQTFRLIQKSPKERIRGMTDSAEIFSRMITRNNVDPIIMETIKVAKMRP